MSRNKENMSLIIFGTNIPNAASTYLSTIPDITKGDQKVLGLT